MIKVYTILREMSTLISWARVRRDAKPISGDLERVLAKMVFPVRGAQATLRPDTKVISLRLVLFLL